MNEILFHNASEKCPRDIGILFKIYFNTYCSGNVWILQDNIDMNISHFINVLILATFNKIRECEKVHKQNTFR